MPRASTVSVVFLYQREGGAPVSVWAVLPTLCDRHGHRPIPLLVDWDRRASSGLLPLPMKVGAGVGEMGHGWDCSFSGISEDICCIAIVVIVVMIGVFSSHRACGTISVKLTRELPRTSGNSGLRGIVRCAEARAGTFVRSDLHTGRLVVRSWCCPRSGAVFCKLVASRLSEFCLSEVPFEIVPAFNLLFASQQPRQSEERKPAPLFAYASREASI